MENTETLEKILNSKKIRYDNLNILFKDYLNPFEKKGKNVNIFVDIQSITKQMYAPATLEQLNYLKDADRIIIASEILNFVGHYRHYFASRHEMFTKFYFVHSYTSSAYHTKLYPTYRNDYYEKRNNMSHPMFGNLNKILMYNMKFVKTILNYIPEAHFIDSGKIEPSIFPNYIIDNHVDVEDMNLILTNDETYFQDLLLKDKTFILEMRGSDKSKLITRELLIDKLLDSSKKSSNDFPNIDSSFIKIIDGMVPHKNYNTPAVARKGYATSLSLLEKKISEGKIDSLKLNDPEYILSLNAVLFTKDEDKEAYIRNIKLFNHQLAVETQFNLIKDVFNRQLLNLSNNLELMNVNNTIFAKFPINLEYAFNGELARSQNLYNN